MRQHLSGDTPCVSVLARPRWNHTGLRVVAGMRYRLSATGRWTDLQIDAGPRGYPTSAAPWYSRWILRLAEGSRRVPAANWFALIVAIGEDEGTACNVFANRADLVEGVEWTAPRDGELCCYANDVRSAYWNNSGKIELTVRQLP
jgi:hypothetical protein